MSFDSSRFSFHPWRDYFGVVMQQGRVQLDADWNEWVAELGRRLQAGTFDTVGRAVVPRSTPEGFHVLVTSGALTIGAGRMYVDGLLAENHGLSPIQWDAGLAEPSGAGPTPFLQQPYLPFNATSQPAPADAFNPPDLAGGPHLVYLDVWQREVTHLQAPDLIEKAVGIDATGRLQTVWQVKVLANVGTASCATPDADVPGWSALVAPSAARLSNATGSPPGTTTPCQIPPAAGYKGLENQLYRVEIHHGGDQANATFKWSRDNATVAARVLEIQGGNRLVVDSIGRDDVLGFHAGEWIEILDDWHELHQLPGRLHRIRSGDGVDAATRSITLDAALPAGLFPIDAQGFTDPARHTRIRRWDQSGTVRRADGSSYFDLGGSPTSSGIPVPPSGTQLLLENGILIDFSTAGAGGFRRGDHWLFAARTVDGSIESLSAAPPRGIHHHYARLAVVNFPEQEVDCRSFWPPEFGGEGCDCTVCVHPAAHNAGTATIQQAIDTVRGRGGGTVCLDIGTYRLRAPLDLHDARSVRLRGQGWRTVLLPAEAGGAIDIAHAAGVVIENLSVAGIVAGDGTTAMIDVEHSADIQLRHLTVAAAGTGGAVAAAVGFGGIVLAASVEDSVLVAERTIVAATDGPGYLFTANLRLADNILFGRLRGIDLGGAVIHHGQLRIADNLLFACSQAGIAVTGGAVPACTVAVAGNVLQVAGVGIAAGTDNLRIEANEIIAVAGRLPADGIAIETGLDKGSIDRLFIIGNRMRGQRGHGMSIRHRLGQAIISSNVVEDTTGGAVMMGLEASARYLRLDNNQFANLGTGFDNDALPFFGVLLLAADRADVVDNVFDRVARQTITSPLRCALFAASCGDLRVAGNRMHGIGPLTSFNQRTAGIAVTPGFDRLAVDDNSVARLAGDDEKSAVANWQAILLLGAWPSATGAAMAMPIVVPGAAILPVQAGHVYLSGGTIKALARTAGSVQVRGNRLQGEASLLPGAEVLGVLGCLFDQNDIRMVGGDAAGRLAGRVLADHANVANNRLFNGDDGPVFDLRTDKNKYAVLGNLRRGHIAVNGTADTALPPPWNALNVTI